MFGTRRAGLSSFPAGSWGFGSGPAGGYPAPFEQIGKFYYPTAAANLTNVFMAYNDAGAPPASTTLCRALVNRAGRITGILSRISDDLTAGTLTLRAAKGSTFAAQTAEGLVYSVGNDKLKQYKFVTPITFAAGESIGLAISTSSGMTPTATVSVIAWLLVEFNNP